MRFILVPFLLILPLALRATTPPKPKTSTKVQSTEISDLRTKAEQGDAEAQCRLGLCYEIGEGVPRDWAKAVQWYRKAAMQGNAGGQAFLGFCYSCGRGVPQNYSEAYVWFSLSAASGDASIFKIRDDHAKDLSPIALEAAQFRAQKLFEEIQARKGKP